jgi:uncharacterized membrane protein YidH (DUF202 family)
MSAGASEPGAMSQSRMAGERTDLAWNRSGLAIIGCGIVVLRGLTLQGLPAANGAVGGVILGLGIVTYVLAGWHARRRLSDDGMRTRARPIDLLPVAAGVALIGLAAFVLGLLFPA